MDKKSRIATREYSFTVIYEPIKEGGYQVIVPFLPGLITYGRSFEEARSMARDAIICHLEGLKKEQMEIPIEESLVQEKITIALV